MQKNYIDPISVVETITDISNGSHCSDGFKYLQLSLIMFNSKRSWLERSFLIHLSLIDGCSMLWGLLLQAQKIWTVWYIDPLHIVQKF